jgi:CrcB protein
MSEWLAVAVGGALGAALRFGFTRVVAIQMDADLWVATAASNLLGAFALGLLLARLDDEKYPLARPLLATGLLGSFTTFSTLLLENSRLFETTPLQALSHLAFVIGVGLLAFPAGEALGRLKPMRARK